MVFGAVGIRGNRVGSLRIGTITESELLEFETTGLCILKEVLFISVGESSWNE